jgi:hypothetical protein
MPTNKALIVLQENSGRVPLPAGISSDIRDAIFAVVDRLIETIEDVKVRLQAEGRYDVVHLLTDDACSRSNLLDRLVTETQKGRVIDLIGPGARPPGAAGAEEAPPPHRRAGGLRRIHRQSGRDGAAGSFSRREFMRVRTGYSQKTHSPERSRSGLNCETLLKQRRQSFWRHGGQPHTILRG